MDRESAWQIVTEYVNDASLRRHMLAVEAAMRWYADKLSRNKDIWGLVGLLHDFDWQIHPTLDQHPKDGAPILRQRGCDDAIIRPILSHNTAITGVERQDSIDFALLACDEITGLIIAAVLVRPRKNIRDMAIKSVKKKWKDNAFAGGVDRSHVKNATTDFSNACFDTNLDLWQHIANVLAAMQGVAEELELDGQLAGST